MRLERYRDADLEAVVALFTSSVHALAAGQYDAEQRAAWAPQPPDLEQWRARLSAVETLLARVDTKLAGFISFEWSGHIEFLFTSPEFARRGVATTLLTAVEETLVAEETRAMFTEASLVARPFFSRHGFEVEEEQLVTRRGVTFRRFAMHKPLSAAP